MGGQFEQACLTSAPVSADGRSSKIVRPLALISIELDSEWNGRYTVGRPGFALESPYRWGRCR